MAEYIFYTTEGHTEPPNRNKEVENCQILGRTCGYNLKDAEKNLESASPWISDCGFNSDKIMALQILTDKDKNEIMKIVKYLWDDEELRFEECGKPSDHIFNTLKRLKRMCIE